MGRKSRLKKERREAKAREAHNDRIEGPGFTLERDGRFIRQKFSDNPVEIAQANARLDDWVAKAPARINASITEIRAKLAKYPTLSLLAQLTAWTRFGDQENYREHANERLGIELEYPTWLVLQLPGPIRGSNSIADWVDGDDLNALSEEIRGLVHEVLRFHGLADNGPSGVLGSLCRKSKSDQIAVRHPGYEHHLAQLLSLLFARFESELSDKFGFTVSEAVEMSRSIREYVERELGRKVELGRLEHKTLVESLQNGDREFLAALNLPEEAIRQVRKLPRKELEEWLEQYCVLKTWDSFQSALTVDASTVSVLADVSHESASSFLENFSLLFGQEPIADNWPSLYEPLYYAPLIRLGQETYFAHLAITELLWALKPNLENRIKGTSLWQRYDKHRADTVETEALRLLTSILAGCSSYHSLKYMMPDDHGTICQYELDGLIQYDGTLLLVEAKAGSFSPAARRGAPSLEEDLKELLAKGHDQAARAKAYLESDEEVAFHTPDNEELVLRLSDFSRVIELVVTLDSIAPFASDWENLFHPQAKAQSSYRWSVELLDLRIIAEIVEFGPQFLHYIDCLSRLPAHILEFRDVLDTFGSYLQSGLTFSVDSSQLPDMIGLLNHTTDFDDYFLHEQGILETPASKPTMALDATTYSNLKELCESATPGFVERACELLDKWRDTAARSDHDTFQPVPRRRKRRSRNHHKPNHRRRTKKKS